MTLVSYQTIKLSKGKHSSPQDGACVIELASMLAGESFSDNPACVCPVIASFLRALMLVEELLAIGQSKEPRVRRAKSAHLSGYAGSCILAGSRVDEVPRGEEEFVGTGL